MVANTVLPAPTNRRIAVTLARNLLASVLVIFLLERLEQLLNFRDTEWGLHVLDVVLFDLVFPVVWRRLLRVNAQAIEPIITRALRKTLRCQVLKARRAVAKIILNLNAKRLEFISSNPLDIGCLGKFIHVHDVAVWSNAVSAASYAIEIGHVDPVTDVTTVWKNFRLLWENFCFAVAKCRRHLAQFTLDQSSRGWLAQE